MDAPDLLPTRRSLLRRLKDADDQTGWQEFFDTYWKLIYGVALKAGLTDAEAQDAVQETVIAVSKHIGEFKYDPARCSFKTWLLLLTRQRIGRQFQKRRGLLPVQAEEGMASRAVAAPAETERTATIQRVPDPVASTLEALWDEEWDQHVLKVATERVKGQVKAEQFQMFDLYVLQRWPVGEVVRVLRVSRGQVYLAKHRVGRLLKKELSRLARELR
jgi:RNA polymerase sigma-70 factor (ECF subfamily)